MTPSYSRIVVGDIETTGHAAPWDPYASVLEIGLVVCEANPELTQLGEAELIIRPPGNLGDHDRLYATMPPVVQKMHTDSGLWREATGNDKTTWAIYEADRALADWLAGLGVTPESPAPLAGSGVGPFDHPWLRYHTPLLASRLTYWVLDASPPRRLLELAGRGDLVDLAADVDAKPHRALGDAHLHRNELVRYLNLFGGLAPAAAPEPPVAAQAGGTVPSGT